MNKLKLCPTRNRVNDMELMSNWKVKLETPLASEIRKNEETGDYYLAYHHTKYDFSVAEALQQICSEKYNLYRFDNMMLHNVVLRDAMRSFGVKKVVDHIREFAPDNKSLRERFDFFIERHPDGCIGNLDIQVYSIIEDVDILGRTFHGLDDIMAYREMSLCERYMSKTRASSVTPKRRCNIHVGEVWESYPCFDSSDYATETRSYQNYLIRSKSITNDDMQKVKNLPTVGCLEKINEKMPVDVLPLVYYYGDGGFMLVATPRRQKSDVA